MSEREASHLRMPDCDHCGEPVRLDRNGFWVGEDETSDCRASEQGHEVDGSPGR